MVIIIKLLGMAVSVLGVIFATNSDAVKKYILFWKDDKKIKMGGVIAIALGILFLMAASSCSVTWLINLFGIWSIVKGVLLLTLKKKKLNSYLEWWLERPVKITRLLGAVALIFGILLIYSA